MRVLFQGDSITDGGRDYGDLISLGSGYANKVAEIMKESHPDIEWDFINKGISGNRVKDLKARWIEDCLDLDADVVSIMIGINDTWRAFDSQDPTSVEQFEEDYNFILARIKEKTKSKIMIIEPFLLHNSPDKDAWRADLNPKIDAIRRLARKYADIYLAIDGLFASASIQHEPAYWAFDGVHPSEAGVNLIARAYVAALTQLID